MLFFDIDGKELIHTYRHEIELEMTMYQRHSHPNEFIIGTDKGIHILDLRSIPFRIQKTLPINCAGCTKSPAYRHLKCSAPCRCLESKCSKALRETISMLYNKTSAVPQKGKRKNQQRMSEINAENGRRAVNGMLCAATVLSILK